MHKFKGRVYEPCVHQQYVEFLIQKYFIFANYFQHYTIFEQRLADMLLFPMSFITDFGRFSVSSSLIATQYKSHFTL